mmetsp:Transcript_73320/g.122449  ORF Transcript_73320/g.122449 Transcript_73320/m.122449 type:complete len:347 (+) Transcript_73320:71-1111(+)|eukprot:CAMPEP_0119337418 /NCGR_PEP_ID=MMETSP1333-20130426/93962_1 /TAXON_ID=418940 /ORGANISM="Scyphosphaera apsteinii, Strain RCC1455" /LENGTH=346 /DNA_ID=CAMNT_0007348457 /DNA_START=65 /DNA_END=1105 /DNA_ORIENTATION=+
MRPQAAAIALLPFVLTGAVGKTCSEGSDCTNYPSVRVETLSTRPVIGVLAQPAGTDLGGPNSSYIVASYVKWLEAAGVRVAPILWNISKDELAAAFAQVNGLLLPGGDAGTHGGYAEAAWHLLDLAKASNDDGHHFPVWGTCQGHEQLAEYGSGELLPSVLKPTTGTEGWITPLNFTAAASESRLLANVGRDVLEAFGNRPITINLHQYSVYAADFERNGSAMRSFFKVIATNVDSKGTAFVSLMEGRRYPFYGSQFHPEKNAYEWEQPWERNNTESRAEAHSAAAVAAMQYLASFFASEARKNAHLYPGVPTIGKEPLPLIYKFTPVATVAIASAKWEQCYIFRS